MALLIQRQFYPNMSTRLALFPPRESLGQSPPSRRGNLIQPGWLTPKSSQPNPHNDQRTEELQPLQGIPETSETWVELPLTTRPTESLVGEQPSSTQSKSRSGPWVRPEPGLEMWPGDILPSGLLYHSEFVHLPLLLSEEFLCRWDAILSTFPFPERNSLATTAKFIRVDETTRRFELVDPKTEQGPHWDQDLFLARLPEFGPVLDRAYRTMPFSEGKGNLDINFEFFTENDNVFGLLGFFKEFPWLAGLFLLLSSIYGGIHLSAWNWTFPSELERNIWIISCLYIAGALVVYFVLSVVDRILGIDPSNTGWMPWLLTMVAYWLTLITYMTARGFIVFESFWSIRNAPKGVYTSPAWVETFPHF